jgi:putative hydrolase of the HAD superfamily
MDKRVHLFFDLDHTLWDFEVNSRLALRELFDVFKMESLGVPSFEAFLKVYEFENEKAWALYREGKMKKEVLRTIRFKKALEVFNASDSALEGKLASAYLAISPYKTALIPGTIDLLEYLKAKEYPMHILTNGFEEVQGIKMEHSGLSPYFDHVITSEFIGVQKPDPKAFLGSAKHVGAHLETSYMIGDNLIADVLGAKKVGMNEVYFNPMADEHDHELKYEITSLLELKSIL